MTMKKQFHQILIDYYLDNLRKLAEGHFERQRQTDKVIVWLTAISTGTLALIITQTDKITSVSTGWTKTTVGFLLFSILFGVTFRAFIYLLEIVQSELLMEFEGFCFGYSTEQNGPKEIVNTHTIEDIADSLKNDMGLDYDHWLEDYQIRYRFPGLLSGISQNNLGQRAIVSNISSSEY